MIAALRQLDAGRKAEDVAREYEGNPMTPLFSKRTASLPGTLPVSGLKPNTIESAVSDQAAENQVRGHEGGRRRVSGWRSVR